MSQIDINRKFKKLQNCHLDMSDFKPCVKFPDIRRLFKHRHFGLPWQSVCSRFWTMGLALGLVYSIAASYSYTNVSFVDVKL